MWASSCTNGGKEESRLETILHRLSKKTKKNAVTGKADSGCIVWPRTMNIAVGTYRVRPSLCNVVNN